MNRNVRAIVVLAVGAVIVAATYVGLVWIVENAPIETSGMHQVPCPGQPEKTCFQLSVGPPDWAVTLRNITPWILVVEIIVIVGLLILTLRRK